MPDRFGLLYDPSFDRELAQRPDELDFIEIIPDRFMAENRTLAVPEPLTPIPTVFHSLDLSLGSDEPLDEAYLAEICRLVRDFRPMWASDHLAMTHVGGVHVGHLSPIRWSAGAIDTIAGKIARIQDELGLAFLVENIAYYFRIPGADITEAELLHRLVEKTGCGVLLDVNNVAVNAANHGFNPYAYIQELPLHAVREVHIAGHRKYGNMYLDSHGEPVADSVWALLRFVASKLDSLNVILERDQDVPPMSELVSELAIAKESVVDGRRKAVGVACV